MDEHNYLQLQNRDANNVKNLEKFLFIILMVVAIILIVIISGLMNKSPENEIERSAGGYQYTVYLHQTPYKWKIGHNDSVSFIKENKVNTMDLDRFRKDVNQASLQKDKLILSLLYLIIIFGSLLFLVKKKVEILKIPLLCILILGVIAIYSSIAAYIDLISALDSAKFYYLLITK